MDYQNYMNSASTSPTNKAFSNFYFDSSSDTSTPDSLYGSNPLDASLAYSMHNYDAPMPISYFTPQSLEGMIAPRNTSLSSDNSRQRRRSDSPKSVDLEATSTMHLRRRAQNRASQRAFRERKEKHVKGLEYQLEELHEKHQDLLQSYSKQNEEMSKLQTRIRHLINELATARQSQEPPDWNEPLVQPNFDSFDAFSTTDFQNFHSPGGSFGNKSSDFCTGNLLSEIQESS